MTGEIWLTDLQARDLREIEAILLSIQREVALLKPQVVISAYPYDAPKMLDPRSAPYWRERRLEILTLLQKRGVLKHFGDHSRSQIQIDSEPGVIRSVLTEVTDLLGRAAPNLVSGAAKSPPRGTLQEGHAMTKPDHITVHWLLSHMPVGWWWGVMLGAVAVFGSGAAVGNTTFVRELMNKPEVVRSQPDVGKLGAEVRSLRESHTARVDSLWSRYHALIEEGKANYMLMKGVECEKWAKDVRAAIDAENASFAAQLANLRALE